MGTLITLFYLILTFLYFELYLLVFISWRKNRRSHIEVFMINQARRILTVTKKLSGMKFLIDSNSFDKLQERFILICNHQSFVDIAILTAAFPEHPLKFVTKKSLKYGIPTVSKCLRYGKHAFINRTGTFRPTRRALVSLSKLDFNKKNNYNKSFHNQKNPCSFVIFPEGTRTRNGQIGKFHSAGLRILVQQTQLPLVAVAIDGGTSITHSTSLSNMKNIVYKLKILSIHKTTSNRQDISVALTRIRKEIITQVNHWK